MVSFVPEAAVRHAVRVEFRRQAETLKKLLPDAQIEHVGSTAIPNTLTKGDLDIQVRLPRRRFAEAVQVLTRHYARNKKSDWTSEFASFEDRRTEVPVGIQLTVMDAPLDIFWRFRDVLRARPDLRTEYDQLKRRYEGGNMGAYRRAKKKFFDRLRQTEEFLTSWPDRVG